MIKINDELYIDADDHQYILCRITKYINKKSGKNEIEYVSFHKTLSSVLEHVSREFHRKTVHDKTMTLKEAVDTLQNIHDSLKELVDA